MSSSPDPRDIPQTMEELKKRMEGRPEWIEYKNSLLRRAILSLIMQLGGIALAGYFSHWGVSAGLFLILWGRNLRKMAPKPKEKAKEE